MTNVRAMRDPAFVRWREREKKKRREEHNVWFIVHILFAGILEPLNVVDPWPVRHINSASLLPALFFSLCLSAFVCFHAENSGKTCECDEERPIWHLTTDSALHSFIFIIYDDTHTLHRDCRAAIPRNTNIDVYQRKNNVNFICRLT